MSAHIRDTFFASTRIAHLPWRDRRAEVRSRVYRSKDERKPNVLVITDQKLLVETSSRKGFLLLPSYFLILTFLSVLRSNRLVSASSRQKMSNALLAKTFGVETRPHFTFCSIGKLKRLFQQIDSLFKAISFGDRILHLIGISAILRIAQNFVDEP
jgi:hypothetical protein